MDFGLNMAGKIYDNVTTTHEKMKELKRRLEELNALKEDTESRRSTQLLHPRKRLKKEVELWFTNVERINSEILDLEQKVEESNAVSRGWGSLTANLLKKKQEVEELLQQGKFRDSLVVDNPVWIGQALSTTALFGEAAKICMEKIWAYLMDAGVQKIGVWGLGGIGKTTITKLVHNQLLKEADKFNIVIWVTVSKEMSISRIQNSIANAMDVKLDDVKDETMRAGILHEILARKGRYALILDDLWDQLSLEEVGIPEPSDGSKLLLTTRLLDVCRYLNCREVKIPTLSKPDAWSLFSEKVGQEVLNHPHLLPIVESVAEECAGLPLAIVTIASSMKGVCNVHEWRNALHELKRPVQCVNGMEEKVFQQLQFSYNRLQDEKLKHCFLCCALYPEDFVIDANELIELWIAEGLVEEMDSMQKEIDKGHAILNKLKRGCLIEESNEEGMVKMHDVVRDMALHITSVKPRFMVRAGMQLKKIPDVKFWTEDLEKVSLMENFHLQILDWQLQIPKRMATPKCPNLTTLFMCHCSIESIPKSFFKQMPRLKILDLSGNNFKSLPNSISNLETLTMLLLKGCYHLEKVPSFSKLKALRKLDISFTKIKKIPHGMEKLVKLKSLNLSYTEITKMDDSILAKFTSLRDLALINPVKKGGFYVRGEVISGLRKLEIFEGIFFDLNGWNIYVQALLSGNSWPRQYSIFVGPADGELHLECEKLVVLSGRSISVAQGIKIPFDAELLSFENCIFDLCEEVALFSSRFITPVPVNIFSSLSKIWITNCNYIKKLFSSDWVRNLRNLIQLCVGDCEKMEEIIAADQEGIRSASYEFRNELPKFQNLYLWNLPELKSICGANEVLVCDSVKVISIENCPKLKRIPLKFPLQDDGQPSPPPSLKHIFVEQEWWEKVEWDYPNAKSLLKPSVR
ncbi:hypothetical protein PTKIN_Ptkin14bG0110400 [Pterospermum kingtungense]